MFYSEQPLDTAELDEVQKALEHIQRSKQQALKRAEFFQQQNIQEYVDHDEAVELQQMQARDQFWSRLGELEDDGAMPEPVAELIGEILKLQA